MTDSSNNLRDQLRTLNKVGNRLSRARTLDQLCREALELGCGELCFDRLSIWFCNEQKTEITGTYGIDEQGGLRDESQCHTELSPDWPVSIVLRGEMEVLSQHDADLRDQHGTAVGQGDYVIAGLWDGNDIVGMLCCDNLLTGRPLDEDRVDLLALYAGTLGHLVSRIRADEELRAAHDELQARVAERDRVERALRETEMAHEQFLEAVPVGVFVLRSDGTPYYANQHAQDILGKGIVEPMGPDQLAHVYQAYRKSTNELYPGPEMPIVRALHGQAAQVDDMVIHHPDREIPIEVWSSPVTDEQGRLQYAIAAFVDITDRDALYRAMEDR